MAFMMQVHIPSSLPRRETLELVCICTLAVKAVLRSPSNMLLHISCKSPSALVFLLPLLGLRVLLELQRQKKQPAAHG